MLCVLLCPSSKEGNDCKIISFDMESSYFPNSIGFSPPLLEFSVCLMHFQAFDARKEAIVDLYLVW